MGDTPQKNTIAESIEKTPAKNSFLYTIKSAAALMVLGSSPQIKNIGWEEDIRAKQQMLFTELRKVKNAWRSQVTLYDILELVNNAFRHVKEKHSNIYRKEFERNITSIFMDELDLCRQELQNSIDRIFMETRNVNPYRKALEGSIETIFNKYNDLALYRNNLEEYIGHAINTGVDDPDSCCKQLNARIDYIFRRNSENTNIYSCRQELQNAIKSIFSKVKKSDPFRKGLENSIESVFGKYNGLDSYRNKLDVGINHIFSIDKDFDSYRFEYKDIIDDIFISKPFELTKPFYEMYYKLEHYYKSQNPVMSDAPYTEPCELLKYGLIKDNLSGNSNFKSCMLLEHGTVEDSHFQVCKTCVNGIPQHEKTKQKIYTIVKSKLNAEVDKFGIFVFPTDYFIEPDDEKTIIQVRPEGIWTWLKRGFDEEIHDMFFNPFSDKPESTEPLKMDIRPAADSKDQPPNKVKKEGKTDPFAGLKGKYVDMSEYIDCLTEQQYIAYSLHKEYNLTISETSRRMGITRPSVYGLITDAERNIRNNYKNSR